MSDPLVIIGNGMAAARFVEELSTRALGRYAIAVIGDEPRLAYNRVLLSSVLAGEIESGDIELKNSAWWRDRGVTLKYACAAREIDTTERVVRLANGERVPFAKLVIATGSSALRLNVPGSNLAGVHTFRDIRDVDILLGLARDRKRVIVIGGGLLGLEAAYGLTKAGSKVTLLHLMDRLMERQLDAAAAAVLKQRVEEKGVEVLLKASTAKILGDERVEGVELADGCTLAADAVIFAAGIRPNAALAKEAGISVNRGIVVDDRMQTSVESVFALGECAEHRGVCYGLVEPAYEQARVLAEHLSDEKTLYGGSVVSTNLKVSGVSVFSAGDFEEKEGSETMTFRDLRRGIYKKLIVSGDRLTGAVLIGDTQDALWYLDLIRTQKHIATMRHDLMFGRALAEPKAA
ncbi:MAG: NAD(P)/FAD-dependent oxidoreductase [Bradyrhizobiaceae bacterium]|nr:MAG: NAD(P)/FAD-dependent oxidoreductase [Bradyrhizobiaceae bacterium]